MNFLKYSLLRLGILIVVFVISVSVGAGLILSGIAAVVAAFAICYIFFPKLHLAASQDFHRWIDRSPKPRNRAALQDQDIEDSYTEQQAHKDV